MTITTMEQLEAIPEGGTITVASTTIGNRTWSKVPDGWSYDGAVVRSINFIGAVEAGTVTTGDGPPAVGDLYVEAGHHHLILAIPDDNAWVAQFYDNRFQRLQHRPLTYFIDNDLAKVGEGDRPAWCDMAMTMGAALHEMNGSRQNYIAENTRIQIALNTANARVRELERTPVTPEFIRGLHEQLTYHEVDDLDDWLADQGHGREAEHEIDVTINGTIRTHFDTSDAREALGLGSDFEIESVGHTDVEFSRNVTVIKTGVGCQCDEVTREDLTGYLPDNVTGDWAFSVECG